MKKILSSLIIVVAFISIIPVPKKFLPSWEKNNLRYFCVMLPVTGILFGALWLVFFRALGCVKISFILRGLFMMIFSLVLTGGLHLDGLMDTCDAIFSHRDRDTRLKILSDTHAGSFAVMGCVIILLSKTLLFAEIFSRDNFHTSLFFIPIYSRLGMAALLNNLQFARSGGLAFMLGTSRSPRDNFFLAIIFCVLFFLSSKILAVIFACVLFLWARACKKIFGGITGDLLGAFVEISEVVLLAASL